MELLRSEPGQQGELSLWSQFTLLVLLFLEGWLPVRRQLPCSQQWFLAALRLWLYRTNLLEFGIYSG